MRITESRIRQIIREEIEREMGPEKFDPETAFHDFMEDQAGRELADAVIKIGKDVCEEWAQESKDFQEGRPDSEKLYYKVDSKDPDISLAIDEMDSDEWHRLAGEFLEDACKDAWDEESDRGDSPVSWSDFVPPRGSRY